MGDEARAELEYAAAVRLQTQKKATRDGVNTPRLLVRHRPDHHKGKGPGDGEEDHPINVFFLHVLGFFHPTASLIASMSSYGPSAVLVVLASG